MKISSKILGISVAALLSFAVPAEASDYHCNGQAKTSGSFVYHVNGQSFKSGSFLYHANGQSLMSGSFVYYPNGQSLKSGSFFYHANGQSLKSGSFFYYANGQALKSGSFCYYENGSSIGSCPRKVTFPETRSGNISSVISVDLESGEVTEFQNTFLGADVTETYSVNIENGEILEITSTCSGSNDGRVDEDSVRSVRDLFRRMNEASREEVRREVCR